MQIKPKTKTQMYRRLNLPLTLMIVCLMLLSGCGSNGYQIKNIAKTDTDLVTDMHIRAINTLVDDLVVKLYKRNPRELAKVPGQTVAKRLQKMMNMPAALSYRELNGKGSTAAMQLAFDENFQGDRVFALGVGLRGMFFKAYNEQIELFMLDTLDPQKLHDSARNIEIMAWRLSNRRNALGELILLTNSTDNITNLSFERLYGKMIAIQDMVANIVAGGSNRTINNVFHGIAQAVFLPIG